jgi:hypothetical protein
MRIPLFLILISCVSCNSKNNENKNNSKDSLVLFQNFESTQGKTFAVSDVEMADSLLKIDNPKHIFENKILKEILFTPEEYQKYGLVNCFNNGLIETIQECYDNHRPLILSPDAIWLAICQGTSIHINQKYDSLKNVIFIKDKPDEIIVRNDSLEYDVKHWKKLLSSFSEETKQYTKRDYYSFFVSEYSTTSAVEKAVYQITLLESYKKAFDYVGESGCGIPSITLKGNKKDWETILSKLDQLNDLGLSNWATNLKPVISEFVNVFDGKINKEFWKSIYKSASEYNGFYISGWITKFFPYIKEKGKWDDNSYDEEKSAWKVDELFMPNKFLDGDRYLLSTLSTDNFPSGLAKINVKWENHFKGTTKDMEIYAGFFAIKQYSDKSLEPFITWAVCEKNAKNLDRQITLNPELKLKHKEEYWSPWINSQLTDSAIYDVKNYKTHSRSMDYIRKALTYSIYENVQFKNLDWSSDSLKFVVLTNGSIEDVEVIGKNNTKEVNDHLKKVLTELPGEWLPGLAHPTDVLNLMDFAEDQKDIKVRANSTIKIALF